MRVSAWNAPASLPMRSSGRHGRPPGSRSGAGDAERSPDRHIVRPRPCPARSQRRSGVPAPSARAAFEAQSGPGAACSGQIAGGGVVGPNFSEAARTKTRRAEAAAGSTAKPCPICGDARAAVVKSRRAICSACSNPGAPVLRIAHCQIQAGDRFRRLLRPGLVGPGFPACLRRLASPRRRLADQNADFCRCLKKHLARGFGRDLAGEAGIAGSERLVILRATLLRPLAEQDLDRLAD